ncbi:hypothetical protein Syun_015130 [Stephania yunnanensis]|uniref:Uncharacterized protein n=1 Tax=Stephania yunnanensis TaxID=152371 RepID=A0AAP0JLH0_9MAGN
MVFSLFTIPSSVGTNPVGGAPHPVRERASTSENINYDVFYLEFLEVVRIDLKVLNIR